MLITLVASILVFQGLPEVQQQSVSVWRDFMPTVGPQRPNGVMASVDLAESRGPADAIRLEYAGQRWEVPLRFSYFVDTTRPRGLRVARYHSTSTGPRWPVGGTVKVRVRVAGKWADFGGTKIGATH